MCGSGFPVDLSGKAKAAHVSAGNIAIVTHNNLVVADSTPSSYGKSG